jgi:alpha-galactosidase
VLHKELAYDSAGINHIVWLTRLEVDCEDTYPRLFAAMEESEIYERASAQTVLKFLL